MHISILGGTGYAGNAIAAEASKRGHEVTVLSRRSPEYPLDGVEYCQGDAMDRSILDGIVTGQDVVVVALSPREDMEGKLVDLYHIIGDETERVSARLGIVGGAGSLKVAEGGPILADTADFPDMYKTEAYEMADVLNDFKARTDGLDWFMISPAAFFGEGTDVASTGEYRVGGDVLLTDDQGVSEISGDDYARAFLDEIEKPSHHRERFSVAR